MARARSGTRSGKACFESHDTGEVSHVRISVLGTGYLGATHAAALARWGHLVVGVDVDPRRVDQLSRGVPPFHEPGFAELLGEGVRSGRLTFTTDVTAAAHADVHFLCVGTPQIEGGHGADLRALWSAVDSLATVIRPGSVVVGKSTVPVGTAAAVQQRLEGLVADASDVEVAWNPEFLREGLAVDDSLRPERLVLGVAGARAEARLRDVYASVIEDGVPVVCTDLQTAELAKASANVMLASRLSVVNVLAEVLRGGARRHRVPHRDPGARPEDRSSVPLPRPRLRRRLSAQGSSRLLGAGR